MPYNTLFTNSQIDQLFKNNKAALDELKISQPNFKPVALLYAEKLNYKFLVTQLCHYHPAHAFVFADYGDEDLQIHVIDIEKMEKEINDKRDILKSDPSFVGKYNLAIYAKVADDLLRIVTDDTEEEAKPLFEKFNKMERYKDPNKNIWRFRFESI